MAPVRSTHKPISLSKDQNIHIIGGGGSGMSALVQLLSHLGYSLSASDKVNSKYLQNLSNLGIITWVDSKPENIPYNSIIFHSSAIPSNHPEIAYAQRKKLLVFKRHTLLHWLTKQYFTIAIAGTHGKTTTTAWIADLMIRYGLDPTVIVGGTVTDWGSNIRIGKGSFNKQPILIIEADESDNSFLSIKGNIGIITNIALEHVDVYSSFKDVESSFLHFTRSILNNQGKIMISTKICIDNLSEPWKKLVSNHQEAITITDSNLVYKKKKFKIGLQGMHNLHNASCVLSLGLHLNIPIKEIQNSLLRFKGVEKRMEIIFSKYNIRVMDDYAHHPEEIEAVYLSLHKNYKQIYIVWEPHRLSRFLYFFNLFYQLFDKQIGWQNLIMLPIYAPKEDINISQDIEDKLQQFHNKAFLVLNDNPNYKILVSQIKKQIKQRKKFLHSFTNNIIVFMGAGNSSKHAHSFAKELKKSNIYAHAR